VIRTVIPLSIAALAVVLLLLVTRRRPGRVPALVHPTPPPKTSLTDPTPAAPGAPVAARAPGAVTEATPVSAPPTPPASPQRRHDNSGLSHFTRSSANVRTIRPVSTPRA
jgi:hypothetical protein